MTDFAAARRMQQAADDMLQAARNLEGTFERHARFMDDWLQRFEAALEKDREPIIVENRQRVGDVELREIIYGSTGPDVWDPEGEEPPPAPGPDGAEDPDFAPIEVDPDPCPVCLAPFIPTDVCATDIELGTCHAACLEGSPVVDLDTGEPCAGTMQTYAYRDTQVLPSGGRGTQLKAGRPPRVCKLCHKEMIASDAWVRSEDFGDTHEFCYHREVGQKKPEELPAAPDLDVAQQALEHLAEGSSNNYVDDTGAPVPLLSKFEINLLATLMTAEDPMEEQHACPALDRLCGMQYVTFLPRTQWGTPLTVTDAGRERYRQIVRGS